jgi:signal transduction histidine kinase
LYALPALVRGDAEFIYHEGSLVRLPDALLSEAMIDFYSRIDKQGWYKDQFGYYTFAYSAEESNNLILFPGIQLSTDPPEDLFYACLSLAKEDVQKYVRQLFELEKKLVSEASGDINMLVHDLRSISTSIYNSALQARMAVNKQKYDDAQSLIENIMCAQAILKIRTDVLDYLNNPASVIDAADIDLREKTLRVIEAFKPQAESRSATIDIKASGDLCINGPDIFEFIPYVLLENAVKYSPTGGRIAVSIDQQNDQYVFSVTSIGPLIEPDEEREIFGRGVRGRHAPVGLGSGIGLYVLGNVVRSHFNGAITVVQNRESQDRNNSGYFVTTFEVTLPYFQN